MALKSLDEVSVGKKRQWQDGVNQYKWRKGWQRVRLFGLVYTDFRHAVPTKSGKFYYEFCHAYDVENDTFKDNREEACECCKLKIKGQVRHYINMVSIDDWENQPKNPQPGWSPIYMADFPSSLIQAIQSLKPLNNGFSAAHPTKGAIINVKFDPNSDSPALMYQANLDQKNFDFTDEMKELSVVQELDGKKMIHKGATLPGAFVYERSTNSRDEMMRSLERNGHYDTKLSGGAPTRLGAAKRSLEVIEEIENDEELPVSKPRKTSAPVSKQLDSHDEEEPELDDQAEVDSEDEIDIPF